MKYIIRNSRGEYFSGRVQQQTRFHGALVFSPARADAIELEESERDSVLTDAKCPPGASSEPAA